MKIFRLLPRISASHSTKHSHAQFVVNLLQMPCVKSAANEGIVEATEGVVTSRQKRDELTTLLAEFPDPTPEIFEMMEQMVVEEFQTNSPTTSIDIDAYSFFYTGS